MGDRIMAHHENIFHTLQKYFEKLGMEVYPFNIEWYNSSVGKRFVLGYDPKTVAYVVISTPSMFEKAFLPFVRGQQNGGQLEHGTNGPVILTNGPLKDPLDRCLRHHFDTVKSLFDNQGEIETIQDFEILPNRRPKVLVQTAAHVAGAAYYYQKEDALSLHEEGCPISSKACLVTHPMKQGLANLPESEKATSERLNTSHPVSETIPGRSAMETNISSHGTDNHEGSLVKGNQEEPAEKIGETDVAKMIPGTSAMEGQPGSVITSISCSGRNADGESVTKGTETEPDVKRLKVCKTGTSDENSPTIRLDDVLPSSGCSESKSSGQNGGCLAANEVPKCKCQPPWDAEKRIYGVCVHPKYGGWFAIRGVIIFPNLQADLPKRPPVDCCNTRSLCVDVLKRFNGNWQDWSFRDVIPVVEKYSELQKEYFATKPKDRHLLMEKLLKSGTNE